MADQQFPGFEGDDEEAKPAKPAAPKPTTPAKPATGKIAKGDAQPPPLPGAAGPVDYAFEESEEPAPKKKPAFVPPPAAPASDATPATMHPTVGRPGAARPAAPPAEDVDPDLKPGSRKDLWNCPHCGTGNRPGRETCRSCGKSPDDPVVVPLMKKPAVLGAIVGGVVLLLVLLVMALGGTDLELKEATAEAIDAKPRIGGSGTEHAVGDRTFAGRERIAVVGRCLLAEPYPAVPGAVRILLMLGTPAKDRDGALEAKAEFTDAGLNVIESRGPTLALLAVSGASRPQRGQVVSLTGDLGELSGIDPGSDVRAVFVDGFAVGE